MPIGEGEPIKILRFVPQEPSTLDLVKARIEARVREDSLVMIGLAVVPPNHHEIPDTKRGFRIFTAPREPVYQIKELNAFMEDLVTGIDGIRIIPTELLDGSSGNGPLSKLYAMHLGRLFFTEIVGIRTEVVDLAGLETSSTPFDIERTTDLYVYPHRLLAEAVFGDSDCDVSILIDLANGWIKHEWLERLRQGQDPFQKLPVLGIGERSNSILGGSG